MDLYGERVAAFETACKCLERLGGGCWHGKVGHGSWRLREFNKYTSI